jgi:hypothetical protein
MTRARILADYVSSGDELALKAPIAGPTFTGTVAIPNVANLETAVVANTAKVTNATHTGDVTGGTALTIATDAVDIAMLSATGTASATTFLRGDNAWEAAGGGGLAHIITASVGTAANTGSTFTNFWSSSYKTYWIIMRDIGVSNSAAVELRMQYHVTDGSGGTTAETGLAYEVGLSGWQSGNAAYGVGQDGSTSIKICPNLGEEAGRQYNAQFTMNGMSGVDTYCTICGPIGWYHGSDYIVGGALAGHYSGNYATDFLGFQLYLTEGGVFNTGSISIFGIKES